ncbi:protein yippee-like At3g08990 isoform X2 [Actinidia eriantha]|uniref:protein yippee-like At3g08990 isoform X2 n=1 Tax=Actinidia eriantha TaxID=165200 RepID=UPI00258DD1C6|nr:protein yippee-like At3g08990 isoform X2 [Actinidia eriantha]
MIEFPQTPNVHFFLCRQCRAHISLIHDYVHTDVKTDSGIFRYIINVDVEDDPRNHRIFGMRTTADASCTRCGTHLGFKWLVVPDANMVVQAGRFLLSLRKLLLWDGNRILYAHTRSPVED